MILRKAVLSEIPLIQNILQNAIEQRKQDGSDQWQNGYPNDQTVQDDISQGYAYVLVDNNIILAYAAIIFDVEPAYNYIIGKWLTNDDYVVVHRVATSNAIKGKGFATHFFREVERLSIQQDVDSIKVDTNFDQITMIQIFNKLSYTHCGEIFISGA